MRKAIGLTVLLAAAGAAIGGAVWWQHVGRWRGTVPTAQPTMPVAVATPVNAAIIAVWNGGDVAAEAAGELAQLYHANGYTTEAEWVYRRLVVLRPDEFRWCYLLSELLSGSGRLAEAEPWLRRVVELDADNVIARRKLGDLLLKSGRLAEAGASYEQALRLAPDDPHALLGAARTAVEAERWLEARRQLETLVAAHPQFAGGLSLLATVAEVLGETRRAEEMRRRAESAGRHREEIDPVLVTLQDHCRTAYGLRVAAAATADATRTQVLLRRATELAPEEAVNWQQWGRVMQAEGDFDGAEKAYERALSLEATNAQVWLDQVGLARARKDMAAVFRVVEAGLEECPDDAGLNFELGRARVQAGQWREAVSPLERAVALDRYNPTAAVELVALQFRLEQPREAERVMRETLARDPDLAPMLEFLVRFHVRNGEQTEAAAALARLAQAPNNATALTNARREFSARFGTVDGG